MGEIRRFVVVTIDPPRRGIDLALPGIVEVPAALLPGAVDGDGDVDTTVASDSPTNRPRPSRPASGRPRRRSPPRIRTARRRPASGRRRRRPCPQTNRRPRRRPASGGANEGGRGGHRSRRRPAPARKRGARMAAATPDVAPPAADAAARPQAGDAARRPTLRTPRLPPRLPPRAAAWRGADAADGAVVDDGRPRRRHGGRRGAKAPAPVGGCERRPPCAAARARDAVAQPAREPRGVDGGPSRGGRTAPCGERRGRRGAPSAPQPGPVARPETGVRRHRTRRRRPNAGRRPQAGDGPSGTPRGALACRRMAACRSIRARRSAPRAVDPTGSVVRCRAHRHLERQLAHGGPHANAWPGWLGHRAARRRVPPGDEVVRHRVPGHGLPGRWATTASTTARGAGTVSPSSAGSGSRTRSSGFADGGAADAEARLRDRHVRGRAGVDGVRAQRPGGRARSTTHYKLAWLGRLRRRTSRPTPTRREPVALCGDFNIAPDDRRRVEPGRVRGRHPRDARGAGRRRRRSRRLGPARRLPRALHERRRPVHWWDYRAGNFHKHRGMRIDLVLLSADAGRPGHLGPDRPQRPQGQPSRAITPRCSSTSTSRA